MKIEREELLTALQRLKPGLATKDIMIVNTHVWFRGNHITASNDEGLGITVPFKSELKGGLRGALLINLLSNSKAKEVDLEPGDTESSIILKAARTNLKMSLLGVKEALPLPDWSKAKLVTLTPAFLDGLEKVMVSTDNPNAALAEQRGVTVITQAKELVLFSNNGKTISRAVVPIPDGWHGKLDDRFTVPTSFAKLILVMRKDKEPDIQLAVNKTHVFIDNRWQQVYSPLVTVLEQSNWIKISQGVTKGLTYTPIPARLKLALARSAVVLDGEKKEDQFVDIKVENGKGTVLKIATSASLGNLNDTIPLDDDLPPVDIRLDPDSIKAGLPLCEQMAINTQALTLTGGNFTYMVARFGR